MDGLCPEKMRAPSAPPIVEKTVMPIENITALSKVAAARPSGESQNCSICLVCSGDVDIICDAIAEPCSMLDAKSFSIASPPCST